MALWQLRNHFKTIEQNTKIVNEYNGTFTGLRDIEYKSNGGSIVQHASPLWFSNLFLNDKNLNFVDSVALATREYSKFKNKFLELAVKLETVNANDIPNSVDAILKNINAVKNKSFPWYYSDMLPYGDNKVVLEYTVINSFIKQYEISAVYNDLALSNISVLVYLNKVQLIKGVDYYFPQDRAAIILNDSLEIQADDIITIVEYQDTDGSYIPETPSKLGLYPKFQPVKYFDDTYQTPGFVIQGHDGSITPAFNDYRDDLLLEFERRIYNNIKVNYETNILEIYNYVPGKFRATDYNLTEFNRVLTKSFLKWVGANRVDFTTNEYFESGNPWTWNYKRIPDSVNGANLPGTWRAIYNYWFDTDRPHTHPWEMLGFSEEPTWWQDRYGAAPYTGGNTLLWTDLSQGYIHAGPRAGYDLRFARPKLLSIIPVDEYGSLISPEKFAVGSFDSQNLNASYSVGDRGPVETAWRRSSDYPYALQQALALLKPAYYFGSLVNISEYYRDDRIDQLVHADTKQRITPASVCVHGETLTNGSIQRCAGYLNWIIDHVQNKGIIGSTRVRATLNNIDVRLGYKVAGYTDQKYVKVLAEQSSPTSTNSSIIIPDENYKVYLHKSTPIKKSTYSAVIVERSENGYTVSGYDLNNPYFTIIPSLANNNAYAITAINQRAVIYKDFQTRKVTVPYGFEFKTRQQVVDFLVSYGRFLNGQGFRFDQQDTSLKTQRDWILSAQEFLTWSQQGWKAGSLIVLSPAFDQIKFNNANGVVDFVENLSGGSKILDQNFNVVKNNQFTVLRTDNQFSLTAGAGVTICLAELDVVQYEHVLIFDNTTVFNDIIYKPELGNRQYRLKVVGNKTANWSGNLNPPGFVYNSPTVDAWQPGVDYRKGAIVTFKEQYYTALSNVIASSEFDQNNWQMIDRLSIKTGLLPNFAYNAQKFENIYDVDNQPVDSGLDAYSNGLIGFRSREYLNDFSLDQISQAKFYQGYIKEKGTLNAVTGLTNAAFNNITSEIDIYEEWAIRVGEYGAIESDQVLEIEIPEDQFSDNPSMFTLINNGYGVSEEGVIEIAAKDLYRKPISYKKDIFYNRDENSNYANDILTAGYVNLTDVDGTLFNFGAYATLDSVIEKLGKGYKLWVARDFDNDWNVYRVSETDNNVTSLTYSLDGYMEVAFEYPHSLSVGDIFAIKQLDPEFNGFYQVQDITGLNTLLVLMYKNEATLKSKGTVAGKGIAFTLNSMRVDTTSGVTDKTPKHGWLDGDRVWVDDYNNAHWAVLEKSSPWNLKEYVYPQVSEYATELNFGKSLKMSSTTDLIVIGAPGKNEVKTFTRTPTNDFIQTNTLRPQNELVVGFGNTVDVSDYVVAVGAPESFDDQGCVYVYSVGPSSGFTGEILVDSTDGAPGDRFGEAIALSQDNQWLYIGAPGENVVYAYKLQTDVEIFREEIEANGTDTVYTLDFTPIGTSSVTVSNNDKRFIPEIEFTISGNTITFATAPDQSTVVVSQSPYYKFVTELTETGLDAFARYGSTLATNQDGSELYVGAPEQTVDGKLRAGRVYVYNRRSQSFRTVEGINTFITHEPSDSDTVVLVNDAIQLPEIDYRVIDQSIRFNDAPPAGRVVRITQSTFDLVQTLTQDSVVQNSKFGTSITVDHSSSNLFVGAPLYNTPTYQNGAVYRFVDAAKITGHIVGTVQNPTVTAGSALYINGFRVVFTGTTLDSVINDINAENLPGITASKNNNRLQITSRLGSQIKLYFRDYGDDSTGELGLVSYRLDQVVLHPDFGRGENFGYRVAVNESGSTLIVSSDKAATIKETVFDDSLTVYDNRSTNFIDQINDSGAVYQYELLTETIVDTNSTGSFVYTQQLVSPNINPNDRYGYSIDISKNFALVSAPNNDLYVPDGGMVHLYENATGLPGWTVTRQQTDKVDLDSFNRIFVFNKDTNSIITNLDYIDPAKGKVLGIAEQDLDYKTSFDPASYNVVAGWKDQISNFNSNYYWAEQQVGRVWWNLSTLRYIDYEQDSLTYRLKNWGTLFPGSSVDIYEWIESPVVPSLYESQVGDGVPLYTDDSAYCVVNSVDPVTGIIRTKYYFWIKDRKNSAPAGKNNSTANLAHIIESPQLQNIPYATILKSDSLGLFNVKDLLSSDKVVLHIDYANVKNSNSIHSEFELISENNSNNAIPEKILNKLIDSLAGLDRLGQVVPDNTLSDVDKLGISVRPRQTMIANRTRAMENFVKYVNRVFLNNPIAVQYNLKNLYNEDPLPNNTLGDQWHERITTIENLSYINTSSLSAGHRVLVESDSTNNGLWAIYQLTSDKQFILYRIQSFKTDLYWKFVDWYADGYDPTSKVDYLVDTAKDIAKLKLATGDTIRVRFGATGQFEIYQATSSSTLKTVGLQNGTIQLLETVYNLPKGKMSYDQDNFDNIRYDQTPSLEIREIITAIKNDIFIGELKNEFNKLFFSVINYILTEQKSVDWIFKTSFINVVHKLRKLEQFPSFIKDNQDYYLQYIEEVKPYRTQVREYLLDYSADDLYDGDVTDFDLPSYYDTTTKTYRSPNGEQAGDTVRLNQSKYSNWKNNYTYVVDEIVVDDAGTGFITTPQITISGGGGTGATAEATVNFNSGILTSVTVTNPGTGYTSTPTVTINGTGSGARLYPMLLNEKIRKFNSTIKFDRITYNTDIEKWQANVEYTANTIVSFDNIAWKANANIASLDYFDYENFVKVNGDYFENAADRVAAYYAPSTGLPAADLTQLFSGIDYPGVQVQGLGFESNVEFASNAALIDTYIQSTYTDASLGIRAEDINIDGGAYVDTYSSHAPEELVPGIIFDSLNLQVYTREIDANANVISGGTTLGLRVFTGMTSNVKYYRISESNVSTLTSNLSITDSFINVADSSVLPNPGFVLSEGGTWIVIPGIIFINGEKIHYYKNYGFTDQWTANLVVDAGTEIAYNGNVYVTQGNVYDAGGTFANISGNVTMLTTINSLGRIRRAVDGTGAPAVHTVNSMIVDSSKAQEIYFGDESWVNPSSTGNTTVGNTSATFSSYSSTTSFLKLSPSFTPS